MQVKIPTIRPHILFGLLSAEKHQPEHTRPTHPRLAQDTFERQTSEETSLESLVSELKQAARATQTPEKEVEAFALKLFTQYGDTESLIRFARLFDVKVLDNKKHPWVDDYLDDIGAQAAFHLPTSLLYEGQQVDPPHMPENPNPYQQAVDSLFKARQPAIFVSKQVKTVDLMHEIFHLIQYKMGVPFSTTQDSDLNAREIRIDLFHRFRGHDLTMEELAEQAKPFQEMKKLGMPIEQPNSTGHALRVISALEGQTYRFFAHHGAKLGANGNKQQSDSTYAKLYQAVSDISYKYDLEEMGGKPGELVVGASPAILIAAAEKPWG